MHEEHPQASRPIATVADLVECLGGAKAVAEWLRLASETAVYNWIAANSIPRGWSLTLALECWRRGRWVEPRVLDQPDGAFDVILSKPVERPTGRRRRRVA